MLAACARSSGIVIIRVMINAAGEDTTPERARREYHVTPEVMLVRKDGWTLGAPLRLEGVAHRTWVGQWVMRWRLVAGTWTRTSPLPDSKEDSETLGRGRPA